MFVFIRIPGCLPNEYKYLNYSNNGYSNENFIISDLQASVDVHAQDEAEHLSRNFTLSKELSDLKGSYHALSEKLESEKTEMLRVSRRLGLEEEGDY